MEKLKLEILAPAGSPQALTAAVRCGADAVYLGGSSFSARANAQNFDNTALKEAVSYCHARNVKVYLAVNTLLQQQELVQALSLVEYACSLPVDALIVQDMGLVWLLSRFAPRLRLNASTQMSVTSPAGARLLAEQGFSRVVLARELSLKEIKEIRDKTKDVSLELESFVHGALCMSVSGQCYFSSILGSRSGNRGLCAQPCRLPFSVAGGTGHDLSLKDLSMIARLGDLRAAGVSSAKIEGRMKRPEYVAAATSACRYSADGKEIPPALLHNLSAVFSRSGFTTGYPDGELGRGMFGIRSKEDVTGATSAVFSQLRQLYKDEFPRVPIRLSLSIKEGVPAALEVQDQDGHAAAVCGGLPEIALTHPLQADRCAAQLSKTGGTPYFVQSVHCDIQQGLTLPVSVLNQLRRQALAQITEQRSRRRPIPFSKGEIPGGPYHPGGFRLRARFENARAVPELAKKCELIYLPVELPSEQFFDLKEHGFPVAVELPRGIFGTEDRLRQKLKVLISQGITHAWAGTLGAVALTKELGMTVHGGFSLNILNTPALLWYQELGLADTELSFELTLSQAASLGGKLPRGLVIYGRLPLMLCRNCPAANAPGGCAACNGSPLLTDRKGAKFPLRCHKGHSEVLNSVPLYLADRMREIKGQDFGVLHFSVENPVESEEILREHLGLSPVEKSNRIFTRGLYYRGIE